MPDRTVLQPEAEKKGNPNSAGEVKDRAEKNGEKVYKNVREYWSLPTNEQEQIRGEADCMTEEEYQAFLDTLFPPSDSLNEAMRAAGAESDE